jgi:hypothetical protein
MKSRQLKFTMEFVGQVNNLIKGLNINKEAISIHAFKSRQLNERIEGYSKKYKDPEYMKTLSLPEQKALTDNARNAYGVYQNLAREIDYLEMTKHSQFIVNATQALDNAYILIKYFYEEIEGVITENIIPKFNAIVIKDFVGGKYENQVFNLMTEMEVFTHDFYEDNEGHPEELIHAYLAQGYMWLKLEHERLKTEAMPEIKKIEIPKEIEPEFPAGPDEKKN